MSGSLSCIHFELVREYRAKLVDLANSPKFVTDLVATLKADGTALETSTPVSVWAKVAPRVGSGLDRATNGLGKALAEALFPSVADVSRELTEKYQQDLKKWTRMQYQRLLSRLSDAWDKQEKAREQERLSRFNAPRIHLDKLGYCSLKNRPVSDDVKNPRPMPVLMEKPSRFEKPFAFLRQVKTVSSWAEVLTVANADGKVPAPKQGSTPFGEEEYVDFGNMAIYGDKRIDLCKCGIGPKNIGALMESLSGNPYFRHFLFGNNVSGAAGGAAIGAHAKEFETLYLAGNDMGLEALTALCKGIRDSKALRALWLKRNPVLPDGAVVMGDLVSHHETLRILDLDNCGLLDAGVVEIVRGLKHSRSMEHLYIGSNGVTSVGARALAEYFRHINVRNDGVGLKSLFMSTNRIGDDGAEALADDLRDNRTLERLVLSSNSIEQRGGIAIARMAAQHPTLTVLCMGIYTSTADMGELPNRIEDAGAEAFAQMLMENPRLLIVSVAHNAITRDGMNAVLHAAAQHPALLHLDVVERGVQRDKALWDAAHARMEANVRARYGEEMTYSEFLRTQLHRVRNIPETAHIRSIYRTADFTGERRKQMVKRWPDNQIRIEERA